MNERPDIKLDARKSAEIVAEVLARRPGYVPAWSPGAQGADVAVAEIFARYLYAIVQRLNQSPDKNKLAFLSLLGVELIAPQAARAPVIFQLAEQSADTRVGVGLQVAAPPPPETADQIIFEVERATGLAAARLRQVVSLWPGRDQYIDHSTLVAGVQPFEPFKKSLLSDTPHAIYLAHDTLLALAGKSRLEVEVELTTPSSERLDVTWEYWDGKIWRGFKRMHPECEEREARKVDGTAGLTRSGTYYLTTDCAETKKTTVNGLEAFWVRGRLDEPLPPDPTNALPEVERVRLSTVIEQPVAAVEDSSTELETLSGGLLPDKAFTDGTAVDLTKPFYPLGLQPQPGVAFYFSSEEIFSKPGAQMTVALVRTETPQDKFGVATTPAGDADPADGILLDASGTSGPLQHVLHWEYWNGRRWDLLAEAVSSGVGSDAASDFTATDGFKLIVPDDIEPTKVNDQEGLWMRARLMSGSYGFTQNVTWFDARNKSNEFTYVVPQPPALSDFRLGYTWQHGPFHPERVFTYNDFQYEDRTSEAKWAGETFQLFKPVGDVTPALYLGFDKKLPVDRLSVYFDIVEVPGESSAPALVWEYRDEIAWRALTVEDETNDLRVPGLLSFIGPGDAEAFDRFGTPLYWLRARLKEDGPPASPLVNSVLPNAAWVVQRQSISNEELGNSTGQPNQVFAFRQVPVLGGERIEVRELSGLRANVEWRSLAMEVFAGDAAAVRELEESLGREGSQGEVERGDLRLVRDRVKRVTQVWVRWREQKNLSLAGPQERVYAVERIRGRLRFGDGAHGKVPPEGASVMARRYQSGGGLRGNVAAKSITQLLAPVEGVQAVFNARPAEGGGDAETPEALLMRGPRTLRHGGRALLPEDYETLAREASTAVAFARAVPTRAPGGRKVPGWVTLLVIPQSDERRPVPSFGLREQVRKFIESHAPADLAAAVHVYVTGPQYLDIDVETTVAPRNADDAGEVEAQVRRALESFFHPLRGGPEGRGWALGRDVFLSDVASVLERVEGVDYVKELALLRGGARQGERIPVGDDRIVVAGEIKIKLIQE